MTDQNIPTNINKVIPSTSSGTIPVAGKDIPVSPNSVGTTSQGSTPTDLIKGLKEAAKNGVFPEPENESKPE